MSGEIRKKIYKSLCLTNNLIVMKSGSRDLLNYLLVVLLLMQVSLYFDNQTSSKTVVEATITKSLIDINNIYIPTDDDFVSYASLGNGTEENPYIIENYNILPDSPHSPPAWGISIKYTTKYFVIRNCVITARDGGIFLDHVGAGRAKIIDNTFEGDLSLGIWVFVVANTLIANNTFLNQGLGIMIENSANSVIANNTFSVYGIIVYFDEHDDLAECLSYNVYNNTVDGKEIGWFKNQNDLEFDNSDYEQLFFVNCTNITIKNQQPSSMIEYFVGIGLYYCQNANIIENRCGVVSVGGDRISIMDNYFTDTSLRICLTTAVNIKNNSNKDGFFSIYLTGVNSANMKNNTFGLRKYSNSLYLVECFDCTIENNHIFSSGENGISLYYCDSLVIRDNEIYDSEINGLYMRETDNCQIYHNIIARNKEYGISVQENSANNVFYSNILSVNRISGTSQANDGGANNYWYNTSSNTGNYWDDWSGSGAYSIDGTAGSSDSYPLSDTDYDGMPAEWEIEYDLNPWFDDSTEDLDEDGLTNLEEYLHNSNPLVNDTDSDGLFDGEEVNDYGTNPNDEDSDDDNLSDGEEVLVYFTDPNNNDTDGDGMLDGEEIENGTDPLDPDDPKKTSIAFNVVLLAISVGILFYRKKHRFRFQ